jgi:hypothetical protein
VPRAETFGQPVEKLHLILDFESPTLHMKDDGFALHGGRGTFDGSVTFDGGPTFGIAVKTEDVRLEKLLASFSESKRAAIQGALSGAVELHARGANLDEWGQTLDGSGEITVRDGKMPGFNLYEIVTHAVLGRLPSLIFGKGDISLADSNAFQTFEHAFQLSNKGVTADKVKLVTEDYVLTGKGTVSLDGEVEYDTRVAFTATGAQRFFAVAALPIPTGSDGKLPAIPVSITGTMGAPKVKPDVSGVSGLRGLVGAGERAAGNGVRAVGNGVKKLFGGDTGSAKEEADVPAPVQ